MLGTILFLWYLISFYYHLYPITIYSKLAKSHAITEKIFFGKRFVWDIFMRYAKYLIVMSPCIRKDKATKGLDHKVIRLVFVVIFEEARV